MKLDIKMHFLVKAQIELNEQYNIMQSAMYYIKVNALYIMHNKLLNWKLLDKRITMVIKNVDSKMKSLFEIAILYLHGELPTDQYSKQLRSLSTRP